MAVGYKNALWKWWADLILEDSIPIQSVSVVHGTKLADVSHLFIVDFSHVYLPKTSQQQLMSPDHEVWFL